MARPNERDVELGRLQERLAALNRQGSEIHGTIAIWWYLGGAFALMAIGGVFFHNQEIGARGGAIAGAVSISLLFYARSQRAKLNRADDEARRIEDRLRAWE